MDSRNDVEKFMVACGQTDYKNKNQIDLYVKLIREEYQELVTAYAENDIVEIADACADLKWVIEGLELTMQFPQQKIWDEVARSNLAKISDNGKVLKRSDGKVQKPEGWTAPDIKTILKEQ